MKTVYVLSGGGARGGFQAGALLGLEHLVKEGDVPKPDAVVGISVGALNGALVAMSPTRIGSAAQFWLDHIRRPGDIVQERNVMLSVLPALLRGKYDGLVSTGRLASLIEKHVDLSALRRSPVSLSVGAVNLSDGSLTYATPDHADFKKYMLASSAIPVVMPTVEIGKAAFADGGLVDVVPMDRAIEEGADHIVAIICQPESTSAKNFDSRDPFALVDRIMDVITNRIVTANLGRIVAVNRRVTARSPEASGKRFVRVTLIRPPNEIAVSVRDFDATDVEEMIQIGRLAAVKRRQEFF